MACAVGLMAYNEEANVAAALRSVLAQAGPHVRLHSVTVVASGCTDATVPRARQAAGSDPRVRVLEQARREGKATAITAFLDTVREADLVALVGADTRLADGALEALLAPFDDSGVGMTGGRPVPVNARTTLLGRVVHVLWELHHEIALRDPKLGELVAFRRVFDAVPADTAVDEAAIEAMIRRRGSAPGLRAGGGRADERTHHRPRFPRPASAHPCRARAPEAGLGSHREHHGPARA
jgi:glycosyltransferase involved in cell wall biosynthesis